MKKVIIHILAIALSGVLGFIFGKTVLAGEPNKKALLWKIEGKGIKTSYIYGTFHLINKKDFVLNEKVKAAFNETEKLVLELDFDDPNLQTEMMQNSAMKGGQTITALLNDNDEKLVNEALTKIYGVGLQAFDQMKPFMVASMLISIVMDEEVVSYENTFVQMATEQQKEILGLETVKEQMDIFDELSYESQAEDLVEMVEDVEKMKEIFQKMIVFYHAQDIDGLLSIFDDYYTTEYEKELLLVNRNKNWQKRIPQLVKENEVFIAVGAAHLGGETGIINLLKQSGYTLTPIN